MKFEMYRVVRGKHKGQWRWRLLAENGRLVASGESYKRRVDCVKGIDAVKRTYINTVVFDLTSGTRSDIGIP